ncbi:hypothetical protein HWV62_18756 [Athelia sp. TMB]|nr:hypothetical protein HWV62_18756 [Athelia sp. TMB]
MSTKPLILYTASTPNGHKVSILLEELKAIYGPSISYEVNKINLGQNTQKEEWFIKLNPNGRIPVLVDQSRNNFAVFETAAILLYLEQHYDKDHHFSFDVETQPDDWSETLQWIFFADSATPPRENRDFGSVAPPEGLVRPHK